MKTIQNPKAMVEQALSSPQGSEIKNTIQDVLDENNGNAELAFRNKCTELGIDPDMATSMLKGMFKNK